MAVLSLARKWMLYVGATLVFVAVLMVALTAGFSISIDAFLLAVAGLTLIILSIVVGWMNRHKRMSLVILVVLAILIILFFQGPIYGSPVPAPGTPVKIEFAQPEMRTANGQSAGSGDNWTLSITDTGVVVFDITVRNVGGSITPQLSWSFDDARSGMTWNAGSAYPQSNLSALKNIKVNFAVFGIVGGSATTFTLGPGVSQQFHFELTTKYPAGWASLPQSLVGHLHVIGAPSADVAVSGGPTPPAPLAA